MSIYVCRKCDKPLGEHTSEGDSWLNIEYFCHDGRRPSLVQRLPTPSSLGLDGWRGINNLRVEELRGRNK
jgi:hypothetical protein